ncbi:MAG: stage sporulation protein [Propionibacteriaceae bacterium]|jgi:stage II sporulation protein D|nr:hypothetical protein [Propionibacteriaceae bacterium]MDX6320612.1 stage sporulation protein [Propionibacteriaceae bacterium]
MSSPKPSSTQARHRTGRLIVGLSALLSLLATSTLGVTPARADEAVVPESGSFTISGAGFGHGWGMSQYGAYGAAKKGLSWKQILAFYYPGTTLDTLKTGSKIKVWITADSDNDLRVMPAKGLVLTDAAGGSFALPTGSTYKTWRVTRSGDGLQLHYRTASGTWAKQTTTLGTGTWTFANAAKLVRVQLPSGTSKEFRGTVAFVKRDVGGRTVNRLSMEDYLKSVVPSEMPTSWAADGVRTQAVAARTYAARIQAGAGSAYDICDTTACQVYSGYSSISSGGSRRLHETSGGNAAVEATAGTIVRYGSGIALTQFSSSNGGHSAQGDYPYLSAHEDPYDSVVTSNAWTRTITAKSLANVWPSVGTARQLQVTKRDGDGRWGGRVTSIKIIGSKKSITVSGVSFQRTFGMRSNLFTVKGGTAITAAPVAVRPGKAYAAFPRSYHSANRAELLMINSAGKLVRYPVAASGALSKGKTLASGFGSYTHVLNAGDWNGDGYQDVIARTAGERLLLFRGDASGGLKTGVDMKLRSNHTSLTSVGDFNGDRRPDLVVVSNSGNLYLVLGNGKTGFAGFTKLATGWGGRDWMRSPGDISGDGRPDLITRVGDRLYLHKGTNKSFSKPVVLGWSGWSRVAAITSIGDFDGDKRADLLARNANSQLVLYRGSGKGTLLPAKTLPNTYPNLRFAL